ncbi:PREDICTED: vitamin K-dependent protein Z isoform X2 [Calidris pugnax]|uniref:vitamin K-dependent protein Z isoform X2 n=1 Tax=Calidris pugnax TaxID=198806 RepID=UPI00071C428C|nr:PREDICTED: vitamin K-dependent protein Z isoform X2 [Calidris pugnax]
MARCSWTILYLLSALFLQTEQTVFISADDANKVIKRQRRASSLLLEEVLQGSLERECLEERCTQEEAREVFEDDEMLKMFWDAYYGGRRCSSSPCQHNGVCEDSIRGYTCTCAEGYEGENCAFAKNECRHQAKEGCHHFCYPGSNSYRCSCADGYELGKDNKQCIALGPNGTSGTQKTLQVREKHIHIRYEEDTAENNIALLQLQEHVECNSHQLPVCTPERDFAEHVLIPKLAGTVSGWRREGEELQGDELQVSYLPAEDCKQILNVSLTNRQFCGHLQEAVDKRLAGGSFLATEYKGTWFLTGILGSWPLEDADWDTFLFTNTARYMIWFKRKMK